MADVYNIDSVERPRIVRNEEGRYDYEGSMKEEERYLNDMREFINTKVKKSLVDEYAGEVIRFPAADSYAEYMVISASKEKLIHLKIGDEWQSETAYYINTKGIISHVERERKLKEIRNKF